MMRFFENRLYKGLIVTALASGCARSPPAQPHQDPSVKNTVAEHRIVERTVPLGEYKIQRGDRLFKLFEAELKDTPRPDLYQVRPDYPGTLEYTISFHYPRSRHRSSDGREIFVEPLYNLNDVLGVANPGLTFNAATELRYGDKLAFPDLNGNGIINGQKVPTVGYLRFVTLYNSSNGRKQGKLELSPGP